MKLRREQIEAMAVPSTAFSRELCALLNEHGISATLQLPSNELILPSPLEGAARIRFDQRGRPEEARTVSGRQHYFEYDDSHRPSAIVDAGGHRTALRFNELNQLAQLTQPSGARYDFLYEFGLPIEIRRSEANPIRMEYDGNGNLTALIDGKGRSQRFEYDEGDRLTNFSDRLGGVTHYDYQRDGLLNTVTTPTGSVWRSTYDVRSQRSNIFYPNGSLEQYEPSAAPTRFWRRDRESVRLAYDDKLNLTQAEYPGGLTVRLSYNEFGHLTAAENGSHDVHIEYDTLGYRSAEEVNGRRIHIQYGKDQLLALVENHRGERITFGYGADQRINRILDWDGKEYRIAFDASGRLIGVGFPNGTRLHQSFVPIGTLQSQRFTRPGQGDMTRDYEYDANDVLVQVVDSDHGLKRHITDAEDRLIGVSSRHLGRDYEYDAHGNLLSVGAKRFTYDTLDQISSCTTGRYLYDRLGNLIESNEAGRTFRYFYNGQNQLVRAELPDGHVAEYEYDALGRRIIKRVAGVKTTFTWWGDQLLAEDTDGPTPEHIDYLFLPGTSRLLAMRVNGATYYVQTDHLECPIRLVDKAGQVRWAAEPHGYEYLLLINKLRQPFRFPGQYFDEETGLHYNRHRYYDPRTGRYLSPDPLFFKERTNLYLYAGDNPALFCDPSGLFLPLLIIGGALLIGAALGAGHSIASDLSQGRSPNWGNAAVAAGKGVLVVAGGLAAAAVAVATLPVSAPAAAVVAIGAVGALATGAIIAGVEAPEGQTAVACAETIPFVRQFTHDYENDPSLNNPTAQRVVDGSFDLLTLGLMARGARAARGKTVGDLRAALRTPTPPPRTGPFEGIGRTAEANAEAHRVAAAIDEINKEPGRTAPLFGKDRAQTITAITHEKDGVKTTSAGVSGITPNEATLIQNKLNESAGRPKCRVRGDVDETLKNNLEPVDGRKTPPTNCSEPRAASAAAESDSPATGYDTIHRPGARQNNHPVGDSEFPERKAPCDNCSDPSNAAAMDDHAKTSQSQPTNVNKGISPPVFPGRLTNEEDKK